MYNYNNFKLLLLFWRNFIYNIIYYYYYMIVIIILFISNACLCAISQLNSFLNIFNDFHLKMLLFDSFDSLLIFSLNL